MTNQLFEAALGIKSPWFVQAVAFDASQRRLTVGVDFAPGSRFAHPKTTGEHPVYDTQIKRLRHLNFFQHECHLEVRVPRVRLQDGRVALVEPDWVGKLSGFTLLFEALALMLAQQMTFAAVARIVGETWLRVHAICSRYVDLALTHADLSAVDTVAIDETSYKRGHNYLTLAADADARKVVFVTDGRDADTIASFAAHLRAHKADPENITCVVTAQVVDLVQNRRREFARDVGSPVRASMMAQPCFLAVDRNERMSAKSMAPSIERNPPEIFWRNFIMRPSRSA